MVIDCHVHVSALTPGHGLMSRRLLDSLPFRFMRWRFGMRGDDASMERDLAALLVKTIDGAYDEAGHFDQQRTHLYVTNDYAAQLAAGHEKILFGASVNPYRSDAVKELQRCIEMGAALLKWLPIVQGFNPADERCFPLY